jgi:hypothetical protein
LAVAALPPTNPPKPTRNSCRSSPAKSTFRRESREFSTHKRCTFTHKRCTKCPHCIDYKRLPECPVVPLCIPIWIACGSALLCGNVPARVEAMREPPPPQRGKGALRHESLAPSGKGWLRKPRIPRKLIGGALRLQRINVGVVGPDRFRAWTTHLIAEE